MSFEYTRCQVDVKVTKDLIEVYFKDSRIASHKRIKNKINVYSTNREHMPKHHREYIDYTPEQCQHWADKIGPKTEELVDVILDKQTP